MRGEWRRRGQKVALVDLRKAYLQIPVHPSLWSCQTVVFRGQRCCLTRLGFGLNIAPLVLKKVLGTVLSWNERIEQDILVDEGTASAVEVEAHLRRYGLTSKPAERVSDGEQNVLRWKCDNVASEMPNKLTRRAVFSICGQLTSHLPVSMCVAKGSATSSSHEVVGALARLFM